MKEGRAWPTMGGAASSAWASSVQWHCCWAVVPQCRRGSRGRARQHRRRMVVLRASPSTSPTSWRSGPIWDASTGVCRASPLDTASTRALAEASTGKADPLPGIYPDLRQYIPVGKVFTTVPKEKADEILDVEHMIQDDPREMGADQFKVEQVAVCADANLLILMANEYIF